MAKMIYVGHKEFKDKDFVFLYALSEKDNVTGYVAREFKFVKRELIPQNIEVMSPIDVDLDVNDFDKLVIRDIKLLEKGDKK